MNKKQSELITTAAQSAVALENAIKAAYRPACMDNPVLAFAILPLLEKARGVEQGLRELDAICCGEITVSAEDASQ